LLALGLCVRLVWVGVFESETYAELGRSKRERVLTLHELRGSILDRNGEALVMSVPTKLIAADPTIIEDPEAVATQLAAIMGVERQTLVESLERPDSRYSVVARQVAPEVAEQISEAAIRGISTEEDPQRVAVNGDLARAVTGSMDRFATEARSGIEMKFDDQLRASEGVERIERGVGGSTIPGSERVVKAARAGSDVTLTLDRSLQFVADTELARQVAFTKAKGGTVIVGRPQTGEILAMSSVTTVDGKVVQGSLNQAVRLYEPGSVMKLVTIAGAYDKGLLTPDSTLTVPDRITLYDRTIKDSHEHPAENMSVDRILSESSNVGTIKIAQMIETKSGVRSIIDLFENFGFGSKTALELPYEQVGVVKQLWNGTDIGSIPIGQSITVSPVQMWSAYNAIANDGLYVPPKLVRDVVDAEGRHTVPESPDPHRVVSAKAANMVTQGLEKVIDSDRGTGHEFKIPGFNIAAKTGTAYKVQDDGTYGSAATRKYSSSFAGFFPASNPQISIMVMLDEPAYGLHYGGTAAGPVFNVLAKEAMRRFGIAGDAETAAQAPGELIRAQPATRPTTTVPPTTAAPVTVVPDPAVTTAPAVTTGPATPTPPTTPAGPQPTTTAAPPPPAGELEPTDPVPIVTGKRSG